MPTNLAWTITVFKFRPLSRRRRIWVGTKTIFGHQRLSWPGMKAKTISYILLVIGTPRLLWIGSCKGNISLLNIILSRRESCIKIPVPVQKLKSPKHNQVDNDSATISFKILTPRHLWTLDGQRSKWAYVSASWGSVGLDMLSWELLWEDLEYPITKSLIFRISQL